MVTTLVEQVNVPGFDTALSCLRQQATGAAQLNVHVEVLLAGEIPFCEGRQAAVGMLFDITKSQVCQQVCKTRVVAHAQSLQERAQPAPVQAGLFATGLHVDAGLEQLLLANLAQNVGHVDLPGAKLACESSRQLSRLAKVGKCRNRSHIRLIGGPARCSARISYTAQDPFNTKTMTHQTIQVDSFIEPGQCDPVALLRVKPSDLLYDGSLHEHAAKKALSIVMTEHVNRDKMDGLLLSYLDAQGAPRMTEFWTPWLPKGLAARGSVYLEDGTRLFRLQVSRVKELPVLDLTE